MAKPKAAKNHSKSKWLQVHKLVRVFRLCQWLFFVSVKQDTLLVTGFLPVFNNERIIMKNFKMLTSVAALSAVALFLVSGCSDPALEKKTADLVARGKAAAENCEESLDPIESPVFSCYHFEKLLNSSPLDVDKLEKQVISFEKAREAYKKTLNKELEQDVETMRYQAGLSTKNLESNFAKYGKYLDKKLFDDYRLAIKKFEEYADETEPMVGKLSAVECKKVFKKMGDLSVDKNRKSAAVHDAINAAKADGTISWFK